MKKVASSYMIQARCNALQFGMTKLITVGIFVQGFWFGLYLVDHGMDPSYVLTTFYACLATMQSVETILPQWLVLAKGISAGQILKAIMIMVQMEDGRKVNHMVGRTKPMPFSAGNIEVNEVSPESPALKL
jgi:ATP-binding cassette subfamily B (MDR/TAP) protein 1